MGSLDDQQRAKAIELVRKIKSLPPGPDALWNLLGDVGSGKSSVLRQVAEVLRDEKFVPLCLSAPAREIDSGLIALLQTASELKDHELLNGEMAVISDPKRRWPEKMATITDAVTRHRERIVILCDEPTFWYKRARKDDTPDHCARSFAEWIAREASCRRIMTGRIPGNVPAAGRTWIERLRDGRDLLANGEEWGSLAGCASQLREALSGAVRDRSVWEMKLGVALYWLAPASAVARLSMPSSSAKVILEELLDRVEQISGFGDFCATLAKLALARTELDGVVIDELTSSLEPTKKSVVDKCLLGWYRGRGELHPLVRHEVLRRARDRMRQECHPPWRLTNGDRCIVHDRLKDEYRNDDGSALRNSVESLHHDLLGTTPELSALESRLLFVEQLHEVGRVLSQVHGDQRRAAELFRLALQFDPEDPYSHHYLAFNLDWLAEAADEVETHYQAAIRLQPTHPWSWSRWISYLATRGRFREAKSAWRQARDALCVSEDGSPDWIFLSLHHWVARWLLHWSELDFAEEVLSSIPRDLARNDASIQALFNLYAALRQAQRGVSVFPLSVPLRCIGLHRDTEWRDAHLPSLLPPPDRWFERAVDEAGTGRAETD